MMGSQRQRICIFGGTIEMSWKLGAGSRKLGRGQIRQDRKGVFFSLDALVALSLIFLSVLIIYPIVTMQESENFVQDDLIKILSSMKIGETNDAFVQALIANGTITNTNNSVLEQIGEFYVADVDTARALAKTMISTISEKENIGIWYGNTLLASRNISSFEDSENVVIGRQSISGIQANGAVTGFSARAFFKSDYQTKYFYFGGYVGEGNISALINYEGNVTSATMELAIDQDFDVYVNGIYSGSYNKSDSISSPKSYVLPVDDFTSGDNVVELRGNYLHVTGGFIKLTYDASVQYTMPNQYKFPGINGVINLYDGFYIPGNLSNMEISLHFNSTAPIFLSIGNTRVFDNVTNGVENITLSDLYLSSLLNYSELSQKTIPLRFGMDNASYIFNITKSADVFSVTDLSGSMQESCVGASGWCCWLNDCSTEASCSSNCGGTFESKIDAAIDANNIFIDAVLNETGNRVGLVGYRSTVSVNDFHELTTDNSSLHAEVNSWTADGGTCICCGINEGVSQLVSNSPTQNFRSLVVMSDGEANGECAEQNTGDAAQDAINAACDAYSNHNIIVYAVGFGSGAEEATLQSIADCGQGNYFFSDVSSLNAVYAQIAQDILDASYSEQTLNLTGTFTSRLYPDSYIEFNYSEVDVPFGLTTAHEKMFTDQNTGSFSVPENSTIVETRVVSYSGSKWTNEVKINNNSIFNLSDYGIDYLELGDPYSINIPNSLVQQNNIIDLNTGLSPFNATGGSTANKIIYYLTKEFATYSSISASADGCIWTVDFEDNTNLTLNIPTNYSNSETCYYQVSKTEYNSNDAIQQATYELFKALDFDSNGKLDVKFTNQNFDIGTSQISGIPYDWSTEVQIRKWD
jgi:hypothetical protein